MSLEEGLVSDDILAWVAMDGFRDYLARVLPGLPADARQDLFVTGIMDSLGVIEVVCVLEEAYEISFEPQDFKAEKFATLEKMVQTVEQVRSRRQG